MQIGDPVLGSMTTEASTPKQSRSSPGVSTSPGAPSATTSPPDMAIMRSENLAA